jgi:hypothetical protein
MKKKHDSNFLVYGLVIGGILSAGLVIFLSSRFIKKTNRTKRERRHKFYEGIDDIFEESGKSNPENDNQLDTETENGIINELFSRSN